MNRNDGALSAEQRERIADACDAAYDFGDTWVRFLRNGNESMLLPVIADLIAGARAEAWDEGYRTCESDFGESGESGDVTTRNPYRTDGPTS